MPLDRFVLILVIAMAAAGATVWLAALVSASLAVPTGWWLLVPVALLASIVWRVVSDRLVDRRDDPSDRTPR